jgi:ribosome-binding protein aMBF1 (putative translation factor)
MAKGTKIEWADDTGGARAHAPRSALEAREHQRLPPLDMLYPIDYKTAVRERIAARMKRLRAQRGLTQEQLAAKAGISRPYLIRLETARQNPTLSTLGKLEKALRVKPGRLLE